MMQIHLSSAARVASAMIASAGLVLALAACGGSPSPGGSGGTSSQLVRFSSCMRAHGVSNFPDPGSNGTIPKMTPAQLGVSDSQFQAAQSACAYLLRPTQAQEAQLMSGMLDFARCMRSHGLPNWPDPTTDSTGPVFDIPGIDPMSQLVSNASDACMHLLPQSTTPGHPTTVELCDGVGEDGRCHGYGNPNS